MRVKSRWSAKLYIMTPIPEFKIIVNNDVQMSVGESFPEGIQIQIVCDHRPLTVLIESFCFAEDASGMVDADSGGTGALLGWSGIFSISFFASSHAFKF
jgi:hypothetical protein